MVAEASGNSVPMTASAIALVISVGIYHRYFLEKGMWAVVTHSLLALYVLSSPPTVWRVFDMLVRPRWGDAEVFFVGVRALVKLSVTP